MPRIRLNKTVIDGLEPSISEVVYWDESLSGFGLKVTPKGRKVFIVLYRTKDGHSRLRKFTIGVYGPVTLAMARAAALKVLHARHDGRDPAGEKRERRTAAVAGRIEDVVAQYRSRHVNQTRSAYETNRVLERELIAHWKGRAIQEITRKDVLERIDEISDRGSPGMAAMTFTVIRAFFNWSVGRGILDRSPCTGLSKPPMGPARDRVLSDTELAAVIFAARQGPQPYGAIVEFLALTGQRRSEVANMKWNEIDLEKQVWTIPGSRSKNGRQHAVHLVHHALKLLPAQQDGTAFVFPTSSGMPFQDFSVAKRQLDKSSSVVTWVLHDLRRTVVSGMAGLGVAPHVSDKVLNHQSGSISGIAAVYQRHEFMAERKAALELWANHLDDITAPKKAEHRGNI